MFQQTEAIAVTTTGSAGSATGTGTATELIYNGRISKVFLDYNAAAPATTDVSIIDGAGNVLWLLSNNNTDGTFYPAILQNDGTDTPLTVNYEKPIVSGSTLNVSVAGADALAPCVTVTITVEEIN
jgi:hypothetical protein